MTYTWYQADRLPRIKAKAQFLKKDRWAVLLLAMLLMTL